MSNPKYWLQGDNIQNFGDYISEFLMQELFYALRSTDEEVRIIGSALDDGFVSATPVKIEPYLADNPKLAFTRTSSRVVFWGCGLRRPESVSTEIRNLIDVLAVRGPLSAANLRLGRDVPIGDPGLLLPALYTPRTRKEFSGRTICIPHFHDNSSDEQLLVSSGADLILRPNIKSGMEFFTRFIDALTSAEFVLASSLHGAIVAAAYRKPFAYFASDIVDVPFKWRDFSASINIDCKFIENISVARHFYQEKIRPAIRLPSMLPLLAHAPYPVRPYALLKILRYEAVLHPALSLGDLLEEFSELIANAKGEIDRPYLQAATMIDELRHTASSFHGELVALRQRQGDADKLVEELASAKRLVTDLEQQRCFQEQKAAKDAGEAQEQIRLVEAEADRNKSEAQERIEALQVAHSEMREEYEQIQRTLTDKASMLEKELQGLRSALAMRDAEVFNAEHRDELRLERIAALEALLTDARSASEGHARSTALIQGSLGREAERRRQMIVKLKRVDDEMEAGRSFGLALLGEQATARAILLDQLRSEILEALSKAEALASDKAARQDGASVKRRANRELRRARELYLAGRLNDALKAFTRASELDSALPKIQDRIEILTYQVELAQVDNIVRESIRHGDEAVQTNDWHAAIHSYEAALRREPQLSMLWLRKGELLLSHAHPIAAAHCFLKTIDKRPRSSIAWVNLGHAAAMLSDHKTAAACFVRALVLAPRSEAAMTAVNFSARHGEDSPELRDGSASPRATAFREPTHLPSYLDSDWPGVNSYWLPQPIRDFLVHHQRIESTPLYTHLMGTVEAFSGDPKTFDPFKDGLLLLDRARLAALQHAVEDPEISIIITAYNNLVYTLTSIVSILSHGARVSFEIIVGDNQSSDETYDALLSVGGCVRAVRHDENLGFIGNCNATASLARGRYVVMLNNDTLVLPDWLDAIYETFQMYPTAGYVGSKLLNGDGTLQEAGGIVWRDGSAWNFGRNSDALLPEFNYLRDVDYISGASIALPTELWNELGGFDPHFKPVYCEDSDLAFRVRERGLRTIYQPASALIHHEGRTNGRDLTTGLKAHQIANTVKLFDRWRTTLERDHFPNGEDVFVARDRSRNKPHILFVDHYIPQWDRDAGSRTVYMYLRLFVEHGFQITFWPDNLNEDREYLRRLQDLGIEVIYSSAYVNGFGAWFSENKKWIDYAFVNRPHIAKNYFHDLEDSDAKIIYYGHDLHFRRALDEFELRGDESIKTRADQDLVLEKSAWAQSHVILYPSEIETDIVRGMVGGDKVVSAIPAYIFDADTLDRAEARLGNRDLAASCSLMFVGGFAHPPNVDAVLWFAENVMPLLRKTGLPVVWNIAGSHAPESVQRLNCDDINILGRVDDETLAALYSSSSLAVIPLRFGAGVKGKLIEAFANGTPTVSTVVGVQGIKNPERVSFVADEADSVAHQIESALRNPQERRRRAAAALTYLRRYYSEASARDALSSFIPEMRML